MVKDYMRKSLMKQGKQLFSRYGLQKTSINDITKSVGIAAGTFYNYYHSKEELYFDILEKEEEKIKAQFLKVDISKVEDPKQTIKRLLLKMIDTIETNPLIKQLLFENNIELIMRKLPKEKLEKHFEKDSETLLPLIGKWQKEGIIVNKDPEVIAGVLRSLFMLTLHKEEIGVTVYRETIELYIDFIVEGFINKEE